MPLTAVCRVRFPANSPLALPLRSQRPCSFPSIAMSALAHVSRTRLNALMVRQQPSKSRFSGMPQLAPATVPPSVPAPYSSTSVSSASLVSRVRSAFLGYRAEFWQFRARLQRAGDALAWFSAAAVFLPSCTPVHSRVVACLQFTSFLKASLRSLDAGVGSSTASMSARPAAHSPGRVYFAPATQGRAVDYDSQPRLSVP